MPFSGLLFVCLLFSPKHVFRQTNFLQASSLSLKLKGFYLLDNLLLPLVEEEFLVVVKVLLAAVTADEVSTVVADSQFRDEDQHFLAFIKDFLTEGEHIGKLFTSGICLLFQGLGSAVKLCFQQFEGFRSVGWCFFLQHGSHLFQCSHSRHIRCRQT